MDLQLAGQVAVIVGGARGLGHAIARAFVAEGAAVALVDRTDATPEVAAALPGSSLGVVADVTDLAAVRAAADAIRARFERVDHLVFAAGIGSGQFGFPFWEVDPERWDRVLRVNLVGAAYVAHAFAPGMAAAGSGSILFLASVAGQIGSQTDPPYSASKAGLINFAQCAAKDLAPFGVRVNSLCPGMIRSDLNRAVYEGWAARESRKALAGAPTALPTYEEWGTSKVEALVPLRRWQTPEDVADMAVFLASKRAGNITGQTVNVDGGYVMHW